MSPSVNIIIANCNYGQWLMGAVNSALNQTYNNISITVVDDGSTDDSWTILNKEIFRPRPHEKVFPSDFDIKKCIVTSNNRDILFQAIRLDRNYGPSFARNQAIDLMIDKTNFFLILDADDEMYPNKTLRLLDAAMRMPNMIGIVYADYMTLNTENELKRIEYKENYSYQRLMQECIIHSGSLISRDVLLKVKDANGYYDNFMRVCEDYDLWLRMTRHCIAHHVPECLSLVRVTPHNSTNSVANETWQQCYNRMRNKFNSVQP